MLNYLDSFSWNFSSFFSVEDAVLDFGADLKFFHFAIKVGKVEKDLLVVGQGLDEAEPVGAKKLKIK